MTFVIRVSLKLLAFRIKNKGCFAIQLICHVTQAFSQLFNYVVEDVIHNGLLKAMYILVTRDLRNAFPDNSGIYFESDSRDTVSLKHVTVRECK